MNSTALTATAIAGLQRRAHRQRWTLAALLAFMLSVTLLSIAIGPVTIPPSEVLRVMAASLGLPVGEVQPQHVAVIETIRLPRTLLGLLVGAALAVAGASMQGLFRNPLADPGLIGVSAGSALAAVSIIVLGGQGLTVLTTALGAFTLPLAAFGGGLITTLVVYRLASRDGQTSVTTLLLAGIAINALCGAGTGLLTYLADDQQLRNLTFWSLGSLGGATWSQVGSLALLVTLPLFALPLLARTLNALLLGEAEAGHLGISVQRMQRLIVALAALAVGAAVAVSGLIGFIGLVVPHLLRLALGPDHRILLPGAALLGGSLLLLADLLARTLVTPAELPIGILTALLGGPFFLVLLMRQRGVAA
ncbi:FecCD family ABC transporter permease [Allochromatium vinosum]|uniref:Transport system permease protein n=1 Tax=Allochromatium vinosum (strain ATCC 17899 / DSM 180 / NBRC 103801 / NCIMB 10441 / D) TaxID=572477 RepID=D3RTW3_ALLVD|nr:iron chelate uptake ABC transporter family permease subunit [Allochromatium vinosum]ADC62622.1 transport system permease protein [Allochromatium vinosum DSM 180]MBK1653372.1 heme ABC transporter permease [Allochromatium vinosum]